MAEYKGTHGTKVQTYTSDPGNPITGQVWYNATANTLRVQSQTTAGAWATGGNLNTARKDAAGAGLYTSALFFGGYDGSSAQAKTESYNGTVGLKLQI